MKQFILFLALVTIISCNNTTEKSTAATPVNVDSLTAAFLAGWNNKDSAAIMKTIADNAFVMNDSLIHSGYSASPWFVSSRINLNTTSFQFVKTQTEVSACSFTI